MQLTGNVQLALFALQSADTRLAATNGPQVVTIRKAVAQDIDKLKSTPSTDLTGLAIKLDTAIDQIDHLPLAGEAPIERATAARGRAREQRVDRGGDRPAALESAVAAVHERHRATVVEPGFGAPHRQRRRDADFARPGLFRA